jgi:hypothetical protein
MMVGVVGVFENIVAIIFNVFFAWKCIKIKKKFKNYF